MPRITIGLFAIVPLSIMSACTPQPSWKQIPDEEDLSYKTSVRIYSGEMYADKPFSLNIESKFEEKTQTKILSSEQCKDVDIVQDSEFLFIFYDKIALTEFSNFIYHDDIPKPILCDKSLKFCNNKLSSLREEGRHIFPICTYK